MHKLVLIVTIAATITMLPCMSHSKGCLKGAAVGGVVGHVAGRHVVVGAAAGCVIGHHQAKMKDKEAAQAAAQSQGQPADSRGAPPTK